MYKKLLISLGILLSLIFSFTICFANNGVDNVKNGVRNVVGGAENAVENAAKDISGASKNATGAVENTTNHTNNNSHVTTTTNNAGYNATRTATTGATFMGMNSTAWTWLILGIAAIAIIALVWYYSTQLNNSNYNNDRND